MDVLGCGSIKREYRYVKQGSRRRPSRSHRYCEPPRPSFYRPPSIQYECDDYPYEPIYEARKPSRKRSVRQAPRYCSEPPPFYESHKPKNYRDYRYNDDRYCDYEEHVPPRHIEPRRRPLPYREYQCDDYEYENGHSDYEERFCGPRKQFSNQNDEVRYGHSCPDYNQPTRHSSNNNECYDYDRGNSRNYNSHGYCSSDQEYKNNRQCDYNVSTNNNNNDSSRYVQTTTTTHFNNNNNHDNVYRTRPNDPYYDSRLDTD